MSDLNVSKEPVSRKEQAETVKNALRYNLELFSNGGEIWSDQCEHAASYLNAVKALVQDYCTLFSGDLCFSVAETARQPDSDFLVTLYYVCNQLEDLQELIYTFQPICRASSKRCRKKRAEILSKLELLTLHSDDILTFLQAETHQKRNTHHATEVQVVSAKEKKNYRCLQPIARSKSGQSSTGKQRPHLVLVKDGYIEERDAPGYTT